MICIDILLNNSYLTQGRNLTLLESMHNYIYPTLEVRSELCPDFRIFAIIENEKSVSLFTTLPYAPLQIILKKNTV